MTIRRLFLLCVALVLALAAVPAMAKSSAAAGPERQILVMVRHAPDHYRPNGAYGGGYGDELARSARQRLARPDLAHLGEDDQRVVGHREAGLLGDPHR